MGKSQGCPPESRVRLLLAADQAAESQSGDSRKDRRRRGSGRTDRSAVSPRRGTGKLATPAADPYRQPQPSSQPGQELVARRRRGSAGGLRKTGARSQEKLFGPSPKCRRRAGRQRLPTEGQGRCYRLSYGGSPGQARTQGWRCPPRPEIAGTPRCPAWTDRIPVSSSLSAPPASSLPRWSCRAEPLHNALQPHAGQLLLTQG